MADAAKAGLLDLEKELTCSICTEVLYQPLTLLDCLHTFCGSCLKEWFSFEATQSKPSKPYPFTCPSCRATVRSTRPNATVTTLLDMYVQANPTRARTKEEKEELKRRYTPGENVLPKIKVKPETREEADDRRIVEEAMEMSLRDAGIRNRPAHERSSRNRARRGEGETTSGSSSRRQVPNARNTTDSRDQTRRIEHQSSLRSLLSSSDIDSFDLEEEILRQIIDDGFLDGIELNGLDIAQEDELSERIAEAYRRRHRNQANSADANVRTTGATATRSRRSSSRQQSSPQSSPAHHGQGRSPRRSGPEGHGSHPPISRPHLLEAYPLSPTHRRRTSSETRRQTSPSPSPNSRGSSDIQRQAARSATDLSSRPREPSLEPRTRQTTAAANVRRITDPERLQPPTSQTAGSQRASPRQVTNNSLQSGQSSPRSTNAPVFLEPRLQEPTGSNGDTTHPTAEDDMNGHTHLVNTQQRHAPSPGLPTPRTTEPTASFPEPLITCKRCDKRDLQYSLHYHCQKCDDGKYDICLQCYRSGRGCLHWFGFGKAAISKYERQAPLGGYAQLDSTPHRLQPREYLQPLQVSTLSAADGTTKVMSSSDPASRLRTGPFCCNCLSFTPQCFWKCDDCNHGEWGFCNSCLGQGFCCTHPLLPVALVGFASSNPSQRSSPSVPNQPRSTTFTSTVSRTEDTVDMLDPTDPFFQDQEYVPLTVSTECAVCSYPIPPSTTRYHCMVCCDGEYELCSSCYQRSVNRGNISTDDGPNGWRRCPQGHRMVVIGFEDAAAGQRRIIDKDLVGGRTLQEGDGIASESQGPEWKWQDQGQQRRRVIKSPTVGGSQSGTQETHPSASSSTIIAPIQNTGHDSTSNTNTNNNSQPTLLKSYPPDGGAGMHVQALWSYWPQEDATDELGFPKNAEIRECEDINGDWFFGVYAGKKGVFPGNFVRFLRSVS